ncbi:MAG: protein kinase, partial [Oscillospiraceae bacterium]|nr:protein kinase [Oscillospiraceae bacterium]
LDEARTLAALGNVRGIAAVRTFFDENGTSYFVMDYVEGVSLKAYLKNNGGKIPYEDAERILVPVMDTLTTVHSNGVIHRDIAADNIYVTRDNEVKLLDFGAAQYSLGEKSHSFDAVLKPGYTPKEQYMRRSRQGPFTDVYALGATFYAALTGYLPPESLERMENDEIVEPSVRGVKLPAHAEEVIMKALEVDAADRFQSMAEFKAALLGEVKITQAAPQTATSPPPSVQPSVLSQPASKKKLPLVPILASAGGLLVVGIVLLSVFLLNGRPDAESVNAPTAEANTDGDDFGGFGGGNSENSDSALPISETDKIVLSDVYKITSIVDNEFKARDGTVVVSEKIMIPVFNSDYKYANQFNAAFKNYRSVFDEQEINEHVNTYEREGDGYGTNIAWSETTTELTYSKNNTVSFCIYSVVYTGGTHPYQSIVGYTFDVNDGKILTLMDVLYADENSASDIIFQAYLDTNYGTEAYGEALANPDAIRGASPYDSIFWLDTDGIHIPFDEYLFFYAIGETEAIIPYTRTDWVKPEYAEGSVVITTPSPTPTPVEHTYEIFVEDVSWYQAVQRCEAKGGHLVTITSREEENKVIALAEGTDAKYVWLGGYTDYARSGYWLTNESFTYSNWYENEPSGSDADGTVEDCMMMWYLKDSGWSWNDQRNDPVSSFPYFKGKLAYVCEFE